MVMVMLMVMLMVMVMSVLSVINQNISQSSFLSGERVVAAH